jgi:hypothetical protein
MWRWRSSGEKGEGRRETKYENKLRLVFFVFGVIIKRHFGTCDVGVKKQVVIQIMAMV